MKYIITLQQHLSHMAYKGALLVCAGGIFLVGCNSEARPVDPALMQGNASVEVFAIQKGRLSAGLAMPGELVAFQHVDIYAKVSSFVKKLSADVGSEVSAGQVLAVLEAPEINSQLSAASSRLQSIEATCIASRAYYNRLLETSKTPGTISPNDLDMALAKQQSDNAQLQVARSAYNEIADNRNYLTIKAPFNGIITARNVSAGAYVGPSGKGSDMPIFTLQEEKKLRLIVAVPEAYSSYLNKKNEITFSVKSLPGDIFTAKVSRLAGALDTRLRSQRIEMDVSNADKRLLPGMVAEISLQMPARDSSFIVPATAVMKTAEGVYIIRQNGSKAEWLKVKEGRTEEGRTEVFGNLVEGDTVVVKAGEEIRNGAALGKLEFKP